jgi:hypothetical protein
MPPEEHPMSHITDQRLYQQGLSNPRFQSPAEVVRWLGAVQAQDYAGAKWALGMRMANATDSLIEQAFNEGHILRTHIMRPTWHFVTPEDIRWIQALTSSRVKAVNATMDRQLELYEGIFTRAIDTLVRALEGGKHLTRAELGGKLAEAGIQAEGMRLGYIVHRAELDSILCSGPRRGKQFTYALLAERAPHAKALPHDEALAELVRRYFTSHGPATVHDFAWWSGLTIADTKAGLDLLGDEMDSLVYEERTYFFARSMPAVPPPDAPATWLLPNYDEYTIAYKHRGDFYDPSRTLDMTARGDVVFDNAIVIDGQVVGLWRRTFRSKAVDVQCATYDPFSPPEHAAFIRALERFGDFWGLPVVLG